jgi:beta-phosphoglucomutase-like phosphatase (HAD superfamily)
MSSSTGADSPRLKQRVKRPQAILFDVDGLLITTGGAGTRSWRWAFDELYGIPADIGEFTESGMPDPVVGRLTFTAVIGHEPSAEELARVVSHYLMRLPEEVAQSPGYRVLAGVEELLPRLCRDGFLLGITTGAVEAAAHIKPSLVRARSSARRSTRSALSSSATHQKTSRRPTPHARSASASRAVTTARTTYAKPVPITYSPLSRKSCPAPPKQWRESRRSAFGGAARAELVAGGGGSDRSANQPASAQGEPGEHVLAVVAPHRGRGSGPVVRFSFRKAPDPRRHPTSSETHPSASAARRPSLSS